VREPPFGPDCQALAREPAHTGPIDARGIDELEGFALMHDIGKVGVTGSILL
jgi:response regulator RpfG family c-di-GMP phosphodiesterase